MAQEFESVEMAQLIEALIAAIATLGALSQPLAVTHEFGSQLGHLAAGFKREGKLGAHDVLLQIKDRMARITP